MRHGLKRPGFVLAPNGQPKLGAQCVGLLDQLFLAAASGSLTRTTPCLRLRIATPVSHQVRLFCPAQAGRVQGAPDRIGADRGQPVWSLAQGFLQQAHGPGSRAVLFAVRGSRPFRQNALLLVDAIAEAWPSAVTRLHGSEPVAVEAADPGGDRLIVPSSDLVSGGCVTGPLSNGQKRSSALDLRGGSTGRTAQAGQGDPFVRSEWAQRVFAVARHGTPQSTRIIPSLYQSSRQMTH